MFDASAAQLLIKPLVNGITPHIAAVVKKRLAVTEYQAVQLDRTMLNDSVVQLQIFNEQIITLKKRKVDVRGESNFSWFGKNADNSSSIILSVLDSDVQGIITNGSSVFRIETIDGLIIVQRINQSLYPKEGCPGNDKITTGGEKPNSVPKNINPAKDLPKPGKRGSYPLQTPGDYKCKLRILVLYNASAAGAVSNINNSTQLCIDEFNQALFNSEVDYEVELAYVGGTSYTQTNYPQDIIRFQGPADGYMDEVYPLREKYSADICVLFVDNNQLCGTAKAILACETDGYCLVNINCAIGNYTFAHEISHLLGCRHNVQADDTEDPYIYGHGYYWESANTPANFRTIMSYDCETGCTRLQYFSNPNVFHMGKPVGSSLYCKNAQVLNENIPYYMSIRPSPAIRTVVQADLAEQNDMVYTVNKIQSSGTVSIASTQYYHFVAGTDIELLPGFEANEGNTFVAEIALTDCGDPTAPADSCGYNVQLDTIFDMADVYYKQDKDFYIYPNPTNSSVNILSKSAFSQLEFTLSSYLGTSVVKHEIANYKANSTVTIDISDQPAGIYFLLVKYDNSDIFVYKVIKQ